MKAKLVKHESGFILYDEDNITIGAEPNVLSSNIFSKLSLKNCQAIERGYDLDELADRAFGNMGYHSTVTPHEEKQFKLGYRVAFREALEILGDKKFSEEDVMLGWDAGVMSKSIVFSMEQLEPHRESYQRNLKPASLQQTEWDVEVEMDILNEYDKPKLDADGCLILKRV